MGEPDTLKPIGGIADRSDGRQELAAGIAARKVLIGRISALIAGPITMALLGLLVQPDTQGYWYTMTSLLALASFFELGLGQVLAIQSAHEGSGLLFLGKGEVGGSGLDRIGCLLSFAVKWGVLAYVFFVVIVGVIGFTILSRGERPFDSWFYIWMVLTVISGFQVGVGPCMAVFEGLGDNVLIAHLRMYAIWISQVMTWLMLWCGADLWAMVVPPLIQTGFSFIFLGIIRGGALKKLLKRNDETFSWTRDFLPLQAKFAVSWMAGYAIFHYATPQAFAVVGAVDAGRLGMSMALVWAVIGIGMSWSSAAAPRFGLLSAQADRLESRALLVRCLRRGVAMALLMATGIVVGVSLLRVWWLDLAERVVHPGYLSCLLATAVAHVVISTLAVHLRAERKEPLLVWNVSEAVIMVGGLVVAAHHWGVPGIVTVFALVHGLLALVGVAFIWRREQRRHSSDSVLAC